MKISIVILLFASSITLASAQHNEKEIFIIGTMHQVPKIVKHSYKPLLKIGLKYNPDAIFVESPVANDTLSWEYLKNGWSPAYKKFYYLNDSLQRTYKFDVDQHQHLLSLLTTELERKDIQLLINNFAYLRDFGNYDYYKYILRHGVKGSKRPLRNEDDDLSFKLALRLGKKMVVNMDDQQTNDEYHLAWRACMKAGSINGDNKINRKLNKKDYKASIIPALLGRLGKHNNTKGTLNRMHILNSYRYVTQKNEHCDLGTRYWDERYARIAENILREVYKSGNEKNLVVIGAGHVIGLKEALEKQDPEMRIRLLYR